MLLRKWRAILTGEVSRDVGETVLMLEALATRLRLAQVTLLAQMVNHVQRVGERLPAVDGRTRHCRLRTGFVHLEDILLQVPVSVTSRPNIYMTTCAQSL